MKTSWGVQLDMNPFDKYRIVKPSIKEECKIPGLNQPHYILWMITKKEKCAGNNWVSFYKFQEMLKENHVTMVLSLTIPQRIPYASTTLKLMRNKDKHWNIKLMRDNNRVLIKDLNNDTQGFIHIIGMSLLWGEQKNWWFVSNEGEEDFNKIKSMFSHVLSVYVYGNPATENEIESTESSSTWSTIPEWIEDTNLEEESKFEEEFVPLDGTDILNIPENQKKIKVPCYCFYNKPMEADELQSRAEKYG